MPDKLKLACLAAGFPGLSREDLTQALSLERKRCGSRGHQRRSHTHTRQGPGSKGWRDLATAGASAPLKPQFRPGGTSQGAQLDPADFPAALLLGSSQDPGGPKSAAGHGAPPRQHGSPWRDAGAAGPGPGSSGSLWSTQRAGRGARHLHPVSDPVQPAARALAPAQAAAAESAVGVAQLAAQHPWAGAELAGLVLRAAGGELDVAGALLLDMAPASGGSSRGRSSDSGQRAPDAAASALVGSSRHGAPASPSSSSIGQAAMDETGEGESEVGDVYYQYRIQATLLTKQWLRAARGACAAYAAGDHSAARRLAAEGRRLRQESLAAHAEAAERIEGHNNASTRWVGQGLQVVGAWALGSAAVHMARRDKCQAARQPQAECSLC